MFKVNLLLFLAICRSLSGRKADLPLYIPKCSLSDPKLSKCLVETANEVIPIITKGDVLYNVPPMAPIIYENALFDTASLSYVLYGVRSNDWNTVTITEMSIDFVKRKVTFVGITDKLEGIAQNYTITKGEILYIPVYGHGKHNMTFVGVKMKYNSRLRFYKKGEDLYMDWFDSTVDMSCERGYFYFENIKSTQICEYSCSSQTKIRHLDVGSICVGIRQVSDVRLDDTAAEAIPKVDLRSSTTYTIAVDDNTTTLH